MLGSVAILLAGIALAAFIAWAIWSEYMEEAQEAALAYEKQLQERREKRRKELLAEIRDDIRERKESMAKARGDEMEPASGPERAREIITHPGSYTLEDLVVALQDCSEGASVNIDMGGGGRAFLVHNRALAEKIERVIAEHGEAEKAQEEAEDWVEGLRNEIG